MIGVLLMSHGQMAQGMLDSLKLFFGDQLSQIEALCLNMGAAIDQFDERIKECVKRLDDGHGVIGFCDLMGGTPYNRSLFLANDRFEVISGMNLGILVETLGLRLSDCDLKDLNIEQLLNTGKEGIQSVNAIVKELKAKKGDR